MHLGATLLVFILLVALLGPMLLQVNNILWEMGFSSLTEHCPWSSFHLANFCSRGWTKSRKLNLFQADLLKIELVSSEGRRKPSCPSDHIWAKWPAGLGRTWVALMEQVENFLSWFCSVFVFGDGSLAMCLRYTNGQTEIESTSTESVYFTVPLGFFSRPLVDLYPVSFLC